MRNLSNPTPSRQGIENSHEQPAFILSYRDQFFTNLDGFLKTFRPFLIAASIAAALDFVSTSRFMNEGNIIAEVNLIIRWISFLLGPFWGPLVGKLGQLVFLIPFTVMFRKWAWIIFVIVTLIYLYAAWFNTWGIDLYTPRFFQFL